LREGKLGASKEEARGDGSAGSEMEVKSTKAGELGE